MPGDTPELEILVKLDTKQLEREKADLVRTLNQLEQDINIGVNIDDTAISGVFSYIDRLDSEGVNIGVGVSLGELLNVQSDIDNLDGQEINVDVDVDSTELDDTQTTVDGIDGENIDVGVNVNLSELVELIRQIDSADGDDVDVDVNVNESSDYQALTNFLSNTSNVISIATTITGGAVDFITGLADISGLSGLLEMDSILGRLNATTSEMIPDADKLINDIFTNGWGGSRSEIAEVLSLSQQYGIEMGNLEEATENALMLSDINGEDPQEILRTMVNLVRNDLVTSFDEAGDVLQTGFQNGLNIGGDFLDTFNEYGTTFKGLGLDAEGAMNLLNAGLDAGIDNTDRIADSFREFRIRVTENPEELQGIFENLGVDELAEDFRQGRISGGEFINSVMLALSGIEDPAERSRQAVEVFGTQFEDFNPQVFLDALTDIDEQLIVTDSALEDAGVELSSNLPDALERAKRVVSVGLGEFLDDQLDITGLLDEMAGDLQSFFDNVQSGASIGASFRMSFDDNRIIEVLLDVREAISDGFFSLGLALADVLDVVPTTSGDGIREALGTLAGGELQIDLATADNTADIEDAVSDALTRGVESSDLLTQLSDQFDSAVEIGDVEQIVALRDAMETIANLSSSELLTEFYPDEDTVRSTAEALQEMVNAESPEFVQNMLDAETELLNVPEEFAEAFQAQLLALSENPALLDVTDMSDFIDLESVNTIADDAVAVLQDSLNESLSTAFRGEAVDTDALTEALSFAGDLEEVTGEEGLVASIEQMAIDAGIPLDELETITETATDNVTQFIGDMNENVEQSGSDLALALDEAGGSFGDFSTRADTELGVTEGRVDQFVGTVQTSMGALTTDLTALSLLFGNLVTTANALPGSLSLPGIPYGGEYYNSQTYNNNTTINPSNPASANQATNTALQITSGFP